MNVFGIDCAPGSLRERVLRKGKPLGRCAVEQRRPSVNRLAKHAHADDQHDRVEDDECRRLAEQEAGRLREDKTLSEPERRQRLEQIQTETQAAMLQTLGAPVCQQYLQRGGEWVTNFTKL